MKLYVIFGHAWERYEGQHAPEVLECWDEFQVEENSEGWMEEVRRCKKLQADAQYVAVEVVHVEVDAKQIRDILLKAPKVKGIVSRSDEVPE